MGRKPTRNYSLQTEQPDIAEDAPPTEIRSATRNEGPRSVLRVMEVLKALSAAPEGLSLARLSSELDTPKTSLLYLLRALESGHYIACAQGLYTLGSGALKLGQSISMSAVFPRCARPTLTWLARESDETTILGVFSLGRKEVSYVEVIESNHPLRFIVRPGDQRPLYSSGIGQVLLAYSSADERRSYIAGTRFEKFTKDTLGRAELASHLEKIRAEGYALNVNGRVDGVLGVSTPIFDETGAILAAISVGAPTARMQEKLEKVITLAMTAGDDISRILGYRGAYPPKP